MGTRFWNLQVSAIALLRLPEYRHANCVCSLFDLPATKTMMVRSRATEQTKRIQMSALHLDGSLLAPDPSSMSFQSLLRIL